MYGCENRKRMMIVSACAPSSFIKKNDIHEVKCRTRNYAWRIKDLLHRFPFPLKSTQTINLIKKKKIKRHAQCRNLYSRSDIPKNIEHSFVSRSILTLIILFLLRYLSLITLQSTRRDSFVKQQLLLTRRVDDNELYILNRHVE